MSDAPIPSRLYRLVHAYEWRSAVAAGVYSGSDHDRVDGFIHLSTAEQIEKTAETHYAGMTDLLLLSLDRSRLVGEVVMEPSRAGALYPHLYGTIPLSAVLEVEPIPFDAKVGFRFPFLR